LSITISSAATDAQLPSRRETAITETALRQARENENV